MCTDDGKKKAQTAWNGWLDERDKAPGEVISAWLKRQTGEGLKMAAEYAKAGIEKAVARADVAMAGRTLLDSGAPAQEVLGLKQRCDQVVAEDADLLKTLQYFSSQYREQAAFATEQAVFNANGAWAQRYEKAVEMLGVPPGAPQRTPVEQDALTILQFRQAKARVASSVLGVPASGGSSSSSSSSPAAAISGQALEQRRAAAQARVQTLLAELFRLHDLKANGVLEEEELIKINEKVAILHYGKDAVDKAENRQKYQTIFREQLDPEGRPVPFQVFRDYMQDVLSATDPNPEAQLMMLEQFIAEADMARNAFRFPSLVSESDAAFVPPEMASARQRHQTMADRVGSKEAAAQQSQASQGGGYQGGQPQLPKGWQPQPPQPDEDDFVPSPLPSPDVSTASAALAQRSRMQPGPSPGQQAAQQPYPANPPPDSRQVSVMSKQAPPPQAPSASQHSTVSQAVPLQFQKGEPLQVWSNSKASWRDGKVLEAFPVACEAEGFAVPAGTLKVMFDRGTVKWIMPKDIATQLRRRPDG